MRSYHFIDSVTVATKFNDEYSVSRYYFNNFQNIGCLQIHNNDEFIVKYLYILNNNGNSIFTYSHSSFDSPITTDAKFTQLPLVAEKKTEELKSHLLGSWKATDFNTEIRTYNDSTGYSNMVLKATFSATNASIQFSGTRNSTQEKFVTEYKGGWDIDETGQYIYIKHDEIGMPTLRRFYLIKIEKVKDECLIIKANRIYLDRSNCKITEEAFKFKRIN